jgi:carbon-monoxide dehydrogenase large subunit
MSAIEHTGVRNVDMPLMPNRVYEALKTGKDVSGMPPVLGD